mmetsp:Transcript_6660/g.23976  ORF Transcript_6660/g.23976 Transcript_6660/m.23976 type:complete len:515 (+) Transcript_6660:3706-5250(+)
MLLDEVHPPHVQVHVPHGTPSHPAVHLDQLRAIGRGVLELHVHHPAGQSDGLQHLLGDLHELLLLSPRQERRGHRPGLVEPGLQRWQVVRDLGVRHLAITEDHVHVHLVTVQVLLHHHLPHKLTILARRLRALGGAVDVLHRAGSEDLQDLRVTGNQVRQGGDLHNPQGRGAIDGLDDGREPDAFRGLWEILRGIDHEAARGGQPRRLQSLSRRILVPCALYGLGRVPWKAERLGEPGHEGHGDLVERADAVDASDLPIDLGDDLQGLVVHCGGVGHVQGDVLLDHAVLQKGLRPGVGAVHDDEADPQGLRALVDEALAGVAGADDDDDGAGEELPAEALALRSGAVDELLVLVHLPDELEGRGLLALPDVALALGGGQGPGQGLQDLLGQKVTLEAPGRWRDRRGAARERVRLRPEGRGEHGVFDGLRSELDGIARGLDARGVVHQRVPGLGIPHRRGRGAVGVLVLELVGVSTGDREAAHRGGKAAPVRRGLLLLLLDLQGKHTGRRLRCSD